MSRPSDPGRAPARLGSGALALAFALALTILLTGGCGQKGSLYLPTDEGKPAAPVSAPAPAADPAAKPEQKPGDSPKAP